MLQKSLSHFGKTLTYFQKGENPQLLIHAGLHGDEHSVIPIVQAMTEKYESQLPDFIFVPTVSPSAVALQTRKNARGLDLNRGFLETASGSNPSDPEVFLNMQLVHPFHFPLLVSFHEDVEFDGFYMYDSQFPYHRHDIYAFCEHLRRQDIKLFTGIDDPKDPVHGYTVVNGHVIWGIHWNDPLNGTFDDWAIKNGIVDRLIMPEIPTSLSAEKKKQVIESVFIELILPFFKTPQINTV